MRLRGAGRWIRMRRCCWCGRPSRTRRAGSHRWCSTASASSSRNTVRAASFWVAQHGAVDPTVSAAVQASLLDLAQYHHALAHKGGAIADRDAAVHWYREYLSGFDAFATGTAHPPAAGGPAVRRRTLRRGGGGLRACRLRLCRQPRCGPRRLCRAGRLRRGRDARATSAAPRADGHVRSSPPCASPIPSRTARRRPAC